MNETRRIDAGSLFWGCALIAIGTLFLLDRLGVADIEGLLHFYWPMILIAFGISRILHHRSLWPGAWLVVIGTWMQLVTLHVAGLTYNTSWPLLLIVFGVFTIARSLFRSGARHDLTEDRHE